jgi:hypothetical protein
MMGVLKHAGHTSLLDEIDLRARDLARKQQTVADEEAGIDDEEAVLRQEELVMRAGNKLPCLLCVPVARVPPRVSCPCGSDSKACVGARRSHRADQAAICQGLLQLGRYGAVGGGASHAAAQAGHLPARPVCARHAAPLAPRPPPVFASGCWRRRGRRRHHIRSACRRRRRRLVPAKGSDLRWRLAVALLAPLAVALFAPLAVARALAALAAISECSLEPAARAYMWRGRMMHRGGGGAGGRGGGAAGRRGGRAGSARLTPRARSTLGDMRVACVQCRLV